MQYCIKTDEDNKKMNFVRKKNEQNTTIKLITKKNILQQASWYLITRENFNCK